MLLCARQIYQGLRPSFLHFFVAVSYLLLDLSGPFTAEDVTHGYTQDLIRQDLDREYSMQCECDELHRHGTSLDSHHTQSAGISQGCVR